MCSSCQCRPGSLYRAAVLSGGRRSSLSLTTAVYLEVLYSIVPVQGCSSPYRCESGTCNHCLHMYNFYAKSGTLQQNILSKH